VKKDEEKELLRQFRNPKTSNAAFEAIVRSFQEKLYWHIRNMVSSHDDADDILQNVFVKSWRSLHNFRGDAGLYTWLYRIATNECLSFLAKKKPNIDISQAEITTDFPISREEESHQSGDAIQKKLEQAISLLPNKQKAVFNLRYYKEMKYNEIAEIMGTSVGALKASYHHAVKKIETFIKED